MMAVLYYTPKTGFWPPFAQMLTDLDKIWQDQLLHGIPLWVQYNPDWCMGGSRPNDNVFVFRLDALALSVIATATWLAGWLAVCHSRYCIKMTKRI